VERLHVIADDLTGACDVAAALLPWPDGVVVYPDGVLSPAAGRSARSLAVCNTQSRTLPPQDAARRVRDALRSAEQGFAGVLLKKIDTGLRGPLGAEIDATMDALGAAEAFVLPAIPEVERTTVRGEQLVAGVPVHRTAFARDPHNPVRESRVAAVIAETARRGAKVVELDIDVVRRPGGIAAALEARGREIVVIDAETDDDLARSVRALLARPRPLLLVGSIGLARALRQTLPIEPPPRAAGAAEPARRGGVLVVLGSVHPAAREQRDHAHRRGALASVIHVPPDDAEAAGHEAARIVGRGETAALTAPEQVMRGSEAAVGQALRTAVAAVLGKVRPACLVLVGGETAFHVFGGLGHPALSIESRPAPLVTHGRLAAGAHRGLRVITKGGSSGGPDLLVDLVTLAAGGA